MLAFDRLSEILLLLLVTDTFHFDYFPEIVGFLFLLLRTFDLNILEDLDWLGW